MCLLLLLPDLLRWETFVPTSRSLKEACASICLALANQRLSCDTALTAAAVVEAGRGSGSSSGGGGGILGIRRGSIS